MTSTRPAVLDRKEPGRPRTFDLDRALQRAMRLFWQKGFDAVSMGELTAAMRINASSLYAAFGSKEELFIAALDRYQALEAATYVNDAFSRPTARAFVERLMRGAADAQTSRRSPGCLMVQGALLAHSASAAVRREVRRRNAMGPRLVQKRLEEAKKAGDLPPDADPAALARFVVAVIRGMAVEATRGATRRDLEAVIASALRAWPT